MALPTLPRRAFLAGVGLTTLGFTTLAPIDPSNAAPNPDIHLAQARPSGRRREVTPGQIGQFPDLPVSATFSRAVGAAVNNSQLYARKIARQSKAGILLCPSISDVAADLANEYKEYSPKDLKKLGTLSGLQLHAEEGRTHPVIIFPESTNTLSDIGTVVRHEMGHNTLNYLGDILNSPERKVFNKDGEEISSRKDFAFTDDMLNRYKADVNSIMKDFRVFGEKNGFTSSAYKEKAKTFYEVAWLPNDVWNHIQNGTLREDMTVNVAPAEIWNSSKEVLAQALASADTKDTSAYGTRMRGLLKAYFPEMTKAGIAIDRVLTRYADANPSKEADGAFGQAIKTSFERDLAAELPPLPVATRPGPPAAPAPAPPPPK
jgi:hypothetical protein